MAGIELAQAWVTISPRTKGMQKEIDKQLKGISSKGEKTGSALGEKITSGMKKTLKVGAAAAGAAAVAGIGMAFKGGLESALNVDTVTRSLSGLHGSAEVAADTMERVGKVSRDSSINHADYAAAAQNLAYIGIEGDQLESILRNTGDAIVGFGGDGSNLERVNDALSKMVNNGKVNREELLQLSDAGIPVFEGLSTHLGVSIEEMNKMVSDGTVGIEDVLSVMENGTGQYFGQLLDASDNVEQSLGSTWKRVKDNVSLDIGQAITNSGILDKLAPMMERLGDSIVNVVGWIVDDFVPALESAGDWIRRNKDWIGPLAVAIGAAAAAWGAWVGAIKLWQTVTKVATGIQAAFNAVMSANPIMLIVIAVAALAAGLAYFFTQTETGQRIWEAFTNAISVGWEWVKQAFATAWEFIQPILSGIWNVLKSVGSFLMDVFVVAFQTGWNLISTVIQWAWNTIIKPTWDAMQTALGALGAFFTWVWNDIIKPAWDALGAGISWVWENIIRPAWDALKAAAQFMWTNVLQPVFNFIKTAWQAMADGIKWVWENVIRLAWDALKNALNALYYNVIMPVLQWIGDRWRDMSWVLKTVGDWIRANVFDKLGEGLDKVKSWFRTAVDAIKNTWDRIGNIARKPVQFIVETVFNNGIRKAWNAVAGFVGLEDKKLDKLGPVAAYASGGVLPGYTPGRDVHNFLSPTGGRLALSGGEAIMRPEWTRAVGGPAAVEAMNKVARTKGVGGVRKNLGEGAAFAKGGVVDLDRRIKRTMAELRPEHGKPYQYGGVGNPSWDCSGLWSGIVQSLNGGSLRGGRIFNTESDFAQFGFEPGAHGRVTIGVMNGGGGMNSHMAGTIDGVNIESGGAHGVQIGGAAIGTGHPSLPKSYTLKEFLGEFISGGGGGSGSAIAALAKRAWDKVIDAIPSFGGGAGPWSPVPGGFLKKASSAMWDWIKSKLPLGGGGSSDVDLSGVSGDVVAKVQEVFKRHGWTGQQWSDAKWIIGKESGWNPTATNPSSGAYGLFQLNPSSGTLQQYLPDRNPDPAVQANAGARYIKDRYGDPTAARRFWEANQWYDQGGYLKPGVTQVRNDTGKPEPVFTHDQWQVLKQSVLSNEQWAAVAKPMVDELEKFANGIRVKQVDKPVEIDDPKAKGSKANEQGEGESTETTAEKEEIKPEEVGAGIAAGLIEGQLDDIRSVFGLPALKDIPAVKAGLEANKAVVESGGESHPVADLLEAGGSGAILDTAQGGKMVPMALKSVEDMARMAPQLANAGMATMAAAASGNPAAAAAAARDAGQTVNIVVDSTQRAFSEYRKMQAKTSAGARGVR